MLYIENNKGVLFRYDLAKIIKIHMKKRLTSERTDYNNRYHKGILLDDTFVEFDSVQDAEKAFDQMKNHIDHSSSVIWHVNIKG